MSVEVVGHSSETVKEAGAVSWGGLGERLHVSEVCVWLPGLTALFRPGKGSTSLCLSVFVRGLGEECAAAALGVAGPA